MSGAGAEPRAGRVRHVVVGVDGSPESSRAARAARVLAHAAGAELHLFRADLGVDEVHPSVEAELRRLAEELSATAATAPLGLAPGRPAELLERYVAGLDGAVACLGSRGRGAIGAALLGSTTCEYLADADRSALVYGPTAQEQVVTAPVRVALCVDGSEHAAALLDDAVRWAVSLDVPLEVVTATTAAPAARGARSDPTAAVAALEGSARGRGVATTGTVLTGHHPVAELLAHLASAPTLGVLSTHGDSGLAPTMLGGTAGALVRSAPAPLLLRRPSSARTAP